MSAPKRTIIKRALDEWLDDVDYSSLNSASYVPSQFALMFVNFIKLVNGDQGEQNKTPPVHLAMLDKVASNNKYIANLCFRGAAKTTLFIEYMILFIAVFGTMPGVGEVSGLIFVADTMDNGVKSTKNNIQFRYDSSSFLQEWIPEAKFTANYMEFRNKSGHRLGVKMFGSQTGLRGTKIFGKRPTVALLDDLISDEDSRSPTAIAAIKDTVYKGVNHALDPRTRKVVLCGTPFNTEDILVEAVESGVWDVNVWPVCERFPCTREEFVGAWDDRFTFEYISEQYEMAMNTGKISAFYQELMLRITSSEDRLIQDEEIRWYSRAALLANKHNYNFYITTDFATSSKQSADFSVISVWAYNAQGDWFWVDGQCEKTSIDKSFNKLFQLVQEYKPISVGVEVSGQQGAYINILQDMMLQRNIWFTFASQEGSNAPGIRPATDKLTRLNVVVPWFKAGKMYFPNELRASVIIGRCMSQIRLATNSGLKGKDDFLDTISMLGYLRPWKPAENHLPIEEVKSSEVQLWLNNQSSYDPPSNISSYIV